ncbi:unnamed protein product [Candidatus Paraburkholderia kirkii UZHbot1]|uniref:WGS project CAFE00000000 data, contig bkir_c10 n=1 Tax=Candidatus Paraburkholderia kirkii UZHbot1 TaxID=1055526 RepID=U3UAC5_9BURK|nr:unnamed protein product [Candidatus Paraburkholderia kirkii UZHbot1]
MIADDPLGPLSQGTIAESYGILRPSFRMAGTDVSTWRWSSTHIPQKSVRCRGTTRYYYLEEQLSFPCEANVRKTMASLPLPTGEPVSVIGLAHEDRCRIGIFVWVRWGQRDAVVPLAQIVPLNGDEPTRVAISDWHDQGYAF